MSPCVMPDSTEEGSCDIGYVVITITYPNASPYRNFTLEGKQAAFPEHELCAVPSYHCRDVTYVR